MTTARIFKPAKTAMQSGRAKTTAWVLELEAETARKVDPLMGWTSGDAISSGQVRIQFEKKEDAIGYAKAQKLPYRVILEQESSMVPKAYSDNFAFRRRKPWTH